MTHTEVIKDGKKKTVTIASLIEQHNGFIYKISSDWLPNFKYDTSITVEDLAQELKEKFLKDLHKYNCEVGSKVLPYMSAIAKNFFISKKNKIMLNHLHPINGDGTLTTLMSLYANISDGNETLTLAEVISSDEDSQENKMCYENLVKKIRTKLDDVQYTPHNFTKRLRSFTRTVFDTLLEQSEEFTNFVLFDHRCCVRASLRKEGTVHRTILIKSSTMGRYLGVDKRAIDLAYSIIKKIMKREMNETREALNEKD